MSLVLALVVALWLPVQVTVSERGTTLPRTTGGLQSEPPPSQAETCISPVIGGTTGTWQARHAHDAVATISWFPGHAFVPSTAVSQSRGRLHISPQLRIHPLLI